MKLEEPVRIDARGLHYKDLNMEVRRLAAGGTGKVILENVYGQRYIGTNLNQSLEIEIHGVPGNDLGAFMKGSRIEVFGNAQDGCGNTMDDGQIVIHGRAGDILGLSARGGKIFVKDDVGYRAGIHMKEYKDRKPVIVIGGTAQDFLAEYMAGGTLIVLGLNMDGNTHNASYIGTGMHGGVIYIRGSVQEHQLGKEVGVAGIDEEDYRVLTRHVGEFSGLFGCQAENILRHPFIKLFPQSLRPYGKLYTY